MTVYYLLSISIFAILFAFGFVLRNKEGKTKQIFGICNAVLLACFFILRYLSEDFQIEQTVGLNQSSPFGTQGSLKALIATLIIWAIFTSNLLMVMYAGFYKKIGILTSIVKYCAFPVYVVTMIFLALPIQAMDGVEAFQTITSRDVFFSLEIGVGLGFSWNVFWTDFQKYKTKPTSKTFLAFLCMFLATIPEFALQVIFGSVPSYLVAKDFTITHRIFLYFGFLLPIIIHFCIRKYEYEQRRFMLLFFALGTMISYCSRYTFASFIDVTSWPLHLCNTAMFIVPICLMFKWEKLYYFTFFINVLGALFAMLMPNYGEVNLISTRCFEFWLNHYCAFFMPILLMSLRIFKRPKLREFIYSLVTFTVYFIIIIFINAWCVTTDFFFVNSNFVAEKLGKWAENLRKPWSFHLGDRLMTLYPLYQIIFYFVYILLALVTWFVYEQFFEIVDVNTEMMERRKKIKVDHIALMSALHGRSAKEPVDMDGLNKLILKDFSKKYSTSDVYAVQNACLEVNGGEIFGFLGPNGAGKSTIIKSIVGIQTITSGAMEVCGYDVEKQPVEAKLQIGFVPDHYALYENLSGREYINYIADLYNVSAEDRTKRIDEYVERFHLQGSFENQMKTYSHGMKQKITIMAALVHDPKLWILDEPLTGLDPESIFQVKECMKAHAAKGNIVFFSSHIIDVVERICDKIAIIKKGNILCTKTVKEIEDSGTSLEDFYLQTIGEINAK